MAVLENARFYGGERGAYWVHKSGRRTHRDILKEDVEYCLSLAGSWEQFEQQLRGLGYAIDWQRFSVKAKDWERAVRLDRMGYSKEGIAECEQILRDADKAKVDLRMLLKGLREFTELKKLTPEIVNTLIQRIEVHNSDRSTGKIRVQVDIYFTAIGLFTIPDEKELQKLMDEIRENPQKYRLSA